MKKFKNIMLGCFVLLISFFIVFIFVLSSSKMDQIILDDEYEESNASLVKTVEELISEVIEGKTLISQRDISSRYLFLLICDEEENYESIIIDKKYVKTHDFEYLIKNSMKEAFWDKVDELLALKYPTYILDGINDSEGNIYYDVYDNEVIIYFDGYTFKPDYNDLVSIKVNYNEVKDYLNFAYTLDDTYQNEDGTLIDDSKKHIAFTFDDGPGGDITKGVVDALVSNKSKATFFMIGKKLNNYKDTVSYVYNNGMEIGTHTYSHLNMKKSDLDTIKDEINKSNEIYKSITGDEFKLLRPPYGSYTKDELNKLEYPFIIWNIDTNDWRYKDKDKIVNHIIDNACDGCIVLMHDVYDTTLEAVKEVLPELYSRGYQVVDVSQLAELKGVNLSSHNVYGYIK